jgi:hypothetical protein
MARLYPPVTLTLPPDVLTALDALAAEDALPGAKPNRSGTLAALVVAEQKRRAKRAPKNSTETP